MALSGVSGSMMRAYAEHTVESRKDTRTLIDTQDTRAIHSAKQQMLLKDRANKEQMTQQLYETVKAGVKTVRKVGKVGEIAGKQADAGRIGGEIKSAVQSGDMEALKAVRMDDTHTLGDSLSDARIQELMATPGEGGRPATIDEQVAQLQMAADPDRAGLRAAIDSGDMDRVRGASVSEHSTVGGRLNDAQVRDMMTAKNDDGSPPSLDQQVSRLQQGALAREVTPEQLRDNILGELDRVAGQIMTSRRSDDEQGGAATAKNRGDIRARRSEMYASKGQAEQDLARAGRLAADAHRPMVG